LTLDAGLENSRPAFLFCLAALTFNPLTGSAAFGRVVALLAPDGMASLEGWR